MDTTTNIETYEVWLDPLGREAFLVPIGLDINPEEGWYPDFKGQRPPYHYRTVKADNPQLWLDWVAEPYAPWSHYDAICDMLRARGWQRRDVDEDVREACEHGMDAQQCYGPDHWHD